MNGFSYQEYLKSYKHKEKKENMTEKEDFPDEPSENNDDVDEFLDEEFDEEIDAEKSKVTSNMTIT